MNYLALQYPLPVRPVQYRADDTPCAISYSGGASSEWLIWAVIFGWVPRPRYLCVVFADTGAEHDWTYERVAFMRQVCRVANIPFFGIMEKDGLYQHLMTVNQPGITRADHPPFYIRKPNGSVGKAIQKCTKEFKIVPMRRSITKWLKSIGQRKRVIKWVGFGIDESHRATKAISKLDVAWETLEFPAIMLQRTRDQQRFDIYIMIGSVPDFSMCVFCPFKTWDRWVRTVGNDLQRAINVDINCRNLDEIGLTDGEAFLNNKLVPVTALVRMKPETVRIDDDCGGGHCFL